MQLDADLSGIRVRLDGLPQPLGAEIARRWNGFLGSHGGSPTIAIAVEAEAPSAREHPFTPKSMRSEVTGDRASFSFDQGVASSGRSGPITVRLHSTTPTLQAAALVNLVTAAIAWRLPAEEALLVHAAGIVLDGHAFLLVGGEGVGKSTWARLAHEAGASVLGDDLVLVQRGAGAWHALASPFRAQASTLRAPGRWPLAATLGAVHASEASLADEPAIRAQARLAANLPFVVDGFGVDPVAETLLDRLVREVPHRSLAFAKDRSFLGVLRDAFL